MLLKKFHAIIKIKISIKIKLFNSMNISIRIKFLLAKAYSSSGLVSKKIRKKSPNSYLILMYHRITPRKEMEPGIQAGMYVEAETFKMHINYLKEHFCIVPLSEISTHIKEMNEMKRKLPICILTFDDGWHDFYKFAYPILEVSRI